MKVIVNGKEEGLSAKTLSVSELLKEMKVEMPDMVSVELNGEILERAGFKTKAIKEGDAIEFLYFMGGGTSKVIQ